MGRKYISTEKLSEDHLLIKFCDLRQHVSNKLHVYAYSLNIKLIILCPDNKMAQFSVCDKHLKVHLIVKFHWTETKPLVPGHLLYRAFSLRKWPLYFYNSLSTAWTFHKGIRWSPKKTQGFFFLIQMKKPEVMILNFSCLSFTSSCTHKAVFWCLHHHSVALLLNVWDGGEQIAFSNDLAGFCTVVEHTNFNLEAMILPALWAYQIFDWLCFPT